MIDGFCGRLLGRELWGQWVKGSGTGNRHGLLGFCGGIVGSRIAMSMGASWVARLMVVGFCVKIAKRLSGSWIWIGKK